MLSASGSSLNRTLPRARNQQFFDLCPPGTYGNQVCHKVLWLVQQPTSKGQVIPPRRFHELPDFPTVFHVVQDRGVWYFLIPTLLVLCFEPDNQLPVEL